MKTDKKTGAVICGKCGEELEVKLVSRIKGYPSKVVFRCNTKNCAGGFMLQKKAVQRIPKKTFGYYNLIKEKK